MGKVMEPLDYEMFIRNVMSFVLSEDIERGGDPAGLAEADLYRAEEIELVKVAVGYCMEILNNHIRKSIDDTSEYSRLEGITKRVVQANELAEISKEIKNYQDTVIDRYFYYPNGRLALK